MNDGSTLVIPDMIILRSEQGQPVVYRRRRIHDYKQREGGSDEDESDYMGYTARERPLDEVKRERYPRHLL